MDWQLPEEPLEKKGSMDPVKEHFQKTRKRGKGGRTLLIVLLTAAITCAITLTFERKRYVALLQLLNNDDFRALKILKSQIDAWYLNDYSEEDVIDAAAHGMVKGLNDPYSEYYNKKEFDDMKIALTGNFSGIGVVVYLNEDDRLEVLSPYKGTPAEKAGILPGDIIAKVDDLVVTGDTYNETISYMRGQSPEAADDTMTLSILRKEELIELSVTRESIEFPTVEQDTFGEITRISISNFEEATARDFKDALDAIDRETVKGVVLDLRDNPGGILDVAVSVLDELLPEGLAVYTEDKNGTREEYKVDNQYNDIPMVVLINENSASASELVAGALQSRGRAKVVGKTSFGKGVVQSVFPMPDGSAIKLTTSSYYTPAGVCIQGKGIVPDVEVDIISDAHYAYLLSYEEDLQLQKAIELLQ